MAGSIIAGDVRFIVIPSAQADALGLGATAAFGSMPVPPASVIACGIVPGEGPAGTSAIESGKDAALTTVPPGIELHAVAAAVPAGAAAETVPIELVFCPIGGAISAKLPDAANPVLDTVGVAGTGVGDVDGGAQTTTVPGVVGFRASGTGASVVSGAPCTVAAENGPGLLSGDVTIAPGTVGRSIAVLPVVATWALLAEQPSNRAASAAHAIRIMSAPPGLHPACEW
ncbi:hypothetical protein ACVIW2_007463 [Bradyrhizobium huanghuaihaiense]|uniref:hypothetical protein n=1 Tax=Bradyrhizobium huanghuaihaiense TaxID=990078 RepID=UPI00035E3EEF|nr:hypothetical protein [Bradyrhizobium huanghuaihaiense]